MAHYRGYEHRRFRTAIRLNTATIFFELARAGAFRLAASSAIRIEVRRVLREKFTWPDDDISDALSDLDECTTICHPRRTLSVIKADPDDDRIPECAVESGSTYIVSGDHHLLQLSSYDGIQIVRVADFLRLLEGC